MQHDLIHPRLRHPLTGEPLRAVGVSRRGPIWPIIGASPEGDPPAGDPPAAPPAGDPPADPPKDADLGDAGKRAIAEEREGRKAAEKRARAAEAEAEKLRTASQSEQEKAVAAARKEGADEVTQRANDRLKGSEARALAATAKFRNPATAVRLLDLSEVKVDDDGEVDSAAIKKLLEQLATDEPYLVDDGKGTPTPPAAAGIGVAGGNSLPTDPRARRLAILEQDIAAGKRNTN